MRFIIINEVDGCRALLPLRQLDSVGQMEVDGKLYTTLDIKGKVQSTAISDSFDEIIAKIMEASK